MRWVLCFMAHRSMPQPGSAGPSPVHPASLRPVPEKAKAPVSTLPERPKRSSFDYWALVFATFVVAAILLVTWRLGGIFWGSSAPSANSNSSAASRVSIPAGNSVALVASARHAGPESAQSKKSTSGETRPQSERKETSAQPVIVRAIVGVDGTVKQAKVVRGNPALAEAALETVRQLNFTPYAPNGTAVEFETEVAVSKPRGPQGARESIQISVPQQTETIQTSHP